MFVSIRAHLVACLFVTICIPHLPFEGAEFLHHPIQQWHHRVNHREAAQGFLQLRHHHGHVTGLPVDVLLSCSETFVQSLVWDLWRQRRWIGSVYEAFGFGSRTELMYIDTYPTRPC